MRSTTGESLLLRREAIAMLLVVTVFASLPVLTPTLASASPPATAILNGARSELPEHDIRIVEKKQISLLLSRNKDVRDATEQVFNNSHTYIVFRNPSGEMLEGWKAQMALGFTSFAAFEDAAADGIPGRFHAVVYDNEAWPLTPAVERAQPHKYARKFKELAHYQHKIFIATPSLDTRGEGSLFFGDAQEADILDLQDQAWESWPSLFSDRLRRAASWARSHNPGVRIVVEISSNPVKDCPRRTSCTRRQAQRTVDNLVQNQWVIDGFWLWIFDSEAGERDGAYMVRLIATALLIPTA